MMYLIKTWWGKTKFNLFPGSRSLASLPFSCSTVLIKQLNAATDCGGQCYTPLILERKRKKEKEKEKKNYVMMKERHELYNDFTTNEMNNACVKLKQGNGALCCDVGAVFAAFPLFPGLIIIIIIRGVVSRWHASLCQGEDMQPRTKQQQIHAFIHLYYFGNRATPWRLRSQRPKKGAILLQ